MQLPVHLWGLLKGSAFKSQGSCAEKELVWACGGFLSLIASEMRIGIFWKMGYSSAKSYGMNAEITGWGIFSVTSF